MNRPTNWQKQRHHSSNLKALYQRWLTYEGSRDKNQKKHSRRGGLPPPLSNTRGSTSRRPQAAHQS
ncbi:hypothetical protein FOXYSP1_21095 [Fusarium oxysporum f. sp. phaseoli]